MADKLAFEQNQIPKTKALRQLKSMDQSPV
jgi:hypothetical protein